MISPISRSSSQEEAIEKVSALKRVCQDAHISRKVVSITLIAVGIILVISGILLLTLTIASLPSAFSIALGATVLALGAGLIAFGIAMRILKKPAPSHQEEDVLASEIIRISSLVEQKTGEATRLQEELGESQRQILAISKELETEKRGAADLQLRLQEAEQGLTQAREENRALQARPQESEAAIQRKEERIQELQAALTSEKEKAQQLDDKVKDLVSDAQKTSVQIATLSDDLARAVANQEGLISRLTDDFEKEVGRLNGQLAAKTKELDAAELVIQHIQKKISEGEQATPAIPMRRSSSTLSLNAGIDGLSSPRSRLSAWWENRKSSRSSRSDSSSGAIPTSESSSSREQSADERSSQNDTAEEAEEAKEDV
ncbi:DUF308 domain-containing protein [Chlamydia caviae]|uniref:IncA family protein n=1 Tax=Chlamydia caviae (strain ATCC VR-813 / DSM 19441 / 03DC25 / GPIC) TaxID=227941 RepID=Q823B2_CHLCV|nr:DUF308 domain-containing protein [Chlamydia caviae]AAP05257.1 hypothetical protein CCA_00513 [Chlamydia caviae GPIC]